MTDPKRQLFIGGKWVDGISGEMVPVRSPATGETLAEVPLGSQEDVDRAVEAARSAKKEIARMGVFERSALLHAVADTIAARTQEIARDLAQEQGKPYHTDAIAEVEVAVDMWRDAAEIIKRLEGEVIPSSDPNKRILAIRQARGVYGVITPWNFPATIPTEYLCAALAAGNAIVWKPSELTPLPAFHLAQAMHDAGVPDGVINVVTGDGPTAGEAIVSHGGTDLKHPRTGETLPARALGAPPADFRNVDDRRHVLADWLTARENPYFAKVIVNRLWAHYFGRGLVEPIDDLRDTNPATNEALFDALAKHLCDSNFDLKTLIRTMLSSNVYRLSSQPNKSNVGDMQNFSHARYKTLPAEVLLDAISSATGVPEKFEGWPRGYRAIQIWDNQMPSYFFRIFGRPVRASVCECERSNEPTMSQAVHLINSPEISGKIQTRAGRARSLANSQLSPEEVIDELYLATLSRFPTGKERSRMLDAFKDSDRRMATEDVLWVLLNTKEFLYSH